MHNGIGPTNTLIFKPNISTKYQRKEINNMTMSANIQEFAWFNKLHDYINPRR